MNRDCSLQRPRLAFAAPRYHRGLLTNALPWGMLDSAYQAVFLTLVIALAIAVVVIVVSRWWR